MTTQIIDGTLSEVREKLNAITDEGAGGPHHHLRQRSHPATACVGGRCERQTVSNPRRNAGIFAGAFAKPAH